MKADHMHRHTLHHLTMIQLFLTIHHNCLLMPLQRLYYLRYIFIKTTYLIIAIRRFLLFKSGSICIVFTKIHTPFAHVLKTIAAILFCIIVKIHHTYFVIQLSYFLGCIVKFVLMCIVDR